MKLITLGSGMVNPTSGDVIIVTCALCKLWGSPGFSPRGLFSAFVASSAAGAAYSGLSSWSSCQSCMALQIG